MCQTKDAQRDIDCYYVAEGRFVSLPGKERRIIYRYANIKLSELADMDWVIVKMPENWQSGFIDLQFAAIDDGTYQIPSASFGT